MSGWTVRLELGVAGQNVKEGGGDAIRLSGDFLLSAIQDGAPQGRRGWGGGPNTAIMA